MVSCGLQSHFMVQRGELRCLPWAAAGQVRPKWRCGGRHKAVDKSVAKPVVKPGDHGKKAGFCRKSASVHRDQPARLGDVPGSASRCDGLWRCVGHLCSGRCQGTRSGCNAQDSERFALRASFARCCARFQTGGNNDDDKEDSTQTGQSQPETLAVARRWVGGRGRLGCRHAIVTIAALRRQRNPWGQALARQPRPLLASHSGL